MYKIKINKNTLRNHVHYDMWKYVVGIIATIFLWNIATTMLAPQTPPEEKVDIYLVGGYAEHSMLEEIQEEIMGDFPELQEVNVYNVLMSEDPSIEYAGNMKLMALIGSHSGDIFIFQREMFENFAYQGAFLPLDGYVDGVLSKYFSEDTLEEFRFGNEYDEEPYICGIPLKDIKLFEKAYFDTSDAVLGIMGYTKNEEGAIDVLEWILENGR